MSVLNNKNCLITGATGGLGQEIAKRLIHDNCNLFLTGQSRTKLQKLKNDLDVIKTSDSKVSYCEGDLRKQNHVKKIITRVRRDFNHIDVLINCAGIFHSKPISQSTIQDFDNILGVNIRAPFLLCKEFSKDMISKKWGRIVNIGSSSSYSGFKNGSIYCSSKHALLGLSRSMFNELKEHGVRTYVISPGSIKTKMGKLSKDQDYETFLDPSEVAKYVEFVILFDDDLVSEEIRLNRINLI
ncbi:MAG: SDR family oxidoreductase [Nitrosopumilaceae archaeon]|nr:SDR family oxidoreductase [Nitrosopumilaceae archaeon]